MMSAQRCLLNSLSDRQAMGLPDHFVDRRPHNLSEQLSDVLRLAADTLAVLCEDASEPFVRRYAAGLALALVGDPRIRSTAPAMADIPAARATLGLDYDQADRVAARWQSVGVVSSWIWKECPAYTAEISPFRIMRYPVTNMEYRDFLTETGHTPLPSSWSFGVYPLYAANQPVWTVSPQDAEAYAAWLSQKTGRAFRLPTEAEWEYAAASEERRQYPWGDEFDPLACNTAESGPLSCTPVGIYPHGRSKFGVFDMAGNVEEFTADAYAPYPGGRVIHDDLHERNPQYRIARGGSFSRNGDLARSQRRHGWFPKDIYVMGFRLAEDLDEN
jgi:formylglycine-generating enzyme required for sulfatase activity